MNRSTKLASGTLGFAVALCVFAVINAGPATAQNPTRGPNVMVVNDETNPVPTKIIGPVAVTAQLSNENPIPVKILAGEPVQIEGSFVIVAGEMVGTDFAYQVPVGKRFVVEYVSFGMKMGEVSFGIGRNEGVADCFIGTLDVEFDNAGNCFSTPIKHFFTQSEDVWIRANRKGGVSGTTFLVEYSVVGYLEPM